MGTRTWIVSAILVLATAFAAEAGSARQTQGQTCRSVIDGTASFVSFSTRTKSGVTIPIDGIMMKPQGAGPFPALVLSHGGHGILPPDCHRHALQAFTAWGYAVLLVDSFSAHHPERNRHGKHTFSDQAQDIYAGMAFLKSRSFVAADRIGLVSWSYGGTAVLVGLSPDRNFKIVRAGQFRAAAVFYPMCLGQLDDLALPLLILVGEADRETPAARCRAMAAASKTAQALELQTYPEVRHAFDFPAAPTYHPDAAKNALVRIRDFLAQHMR